MNLIEHINIGRNNPDTSTYKPPVVHGLRDDGRTLCGLRPRGVSHGWYHISYQDGPVDCKQCLRRMEMQVVPDSMIGAAMAKTITVDQWQAEMERVLARRSDDGQTAGEIAAELGRNVKWVRGRLAALASQGRLVVGRRESRSIDGRPTTIPVYTITEVSHGKK